MDLSYLLVPVAMLGAAGVVYGARYVGARSVLRRKIRAVPRQPIGAARSGEIVRITGRVQSVAEPLVAPISLRKCAYYEAIVERGVKGGPDRIGHELRGHAFLVRDGSGVALVDPRGAAAVITYDVSGEFGRPLTPPDELPDEVDALLRRNDVTVSRTKSAFEPVIAWREGVLAEGELVTVVGRCQWEDAEGAGYRGEGEKRLVITAPVGEKVMLTDDRSVVLASGRG